MAGAAQDPYSELQGKLNDITQRFAHETRFIAHACAAPVRAVPMDRASYASAFTHGDPVPCARGRGAAGMCKSAHQWFLGRAR